jgi:hypothetical protein
VTARTIINININGVPMSPAVSSEYFQPIEEARYFPLMEGYISTRDYQERARKKGKGRKGKNCTKGQVCGLSCISKTRTCLQNMSSAEFRAHNKAKLEAKKGGGVSDASAGAVGVESKPPESQTIPPLLKQWKSAGRFLTNGSSRFSDKTVKIDSGKEVAVTTAFNAKDSFGLLVDKPTKEMMSGDPYNVPPMFEIAFSVYGSTKYSKKNLTDGDRLRLGMTALKMVREDIKKLPDGMLVYNKPESKDGKRDYRARIYEKAGFGPMNKSGGQFAIVKGGKLLPLTDQEFTNKVDSEFYAN